MSTDRSGAAIGRVGAAVDESSPRAADASPRELADLAAAVERVEALIATDAAPGPDGSAALDRIADIAFVLHERDVEPSLCDTLDAALRELNNAEALKRASAQRAHKAAELLRELSRRVNDMIARVDAPQRTEPPAAASTGSALSAAEPTTAGEGNGEEAADDEISRDGVFESDMREDDEFAQAVAALAKSLPSLADETEPASDPQHEPTAGDASPAALPSTEIASDPASPSESPGQASVLDERSALPAMEAIAPMSAAENLAPPALQVPVAGLIALISSTVPQADRDDAVPVDASPNGSGNSAPLARVEPAGPRNERPEDHDSPPRDVDSAHERQVSRDTDEQRTVDSVDESLLPGSRPLVSPDEDPGDLFEPITDAPMAQPIEPAMPAVPPSPSPNDPVANPAQTGAAPASAPDVGQDARSDAAPPPSPAPRAAAAVSPQAVSRPAAIDPLAPVRALSEEELIALFS